MNFKCSTVLFTSAVLLRGEEVVGVHLSTIPRLSATGLYVYLICDKLIGYNKESVGIIHSPSVEEIH